MKVLIDTHVFLWMLYGVDKLSVDTRTVLEDMTTISYLSSVSFYEISYKYRIGKLNDFEDLAKRMEYYAQKMNLTILPVGGSHAIEAGRLDWAHRDPFDRILAGQAICDNLLLLTEDAAFEQVPKLKTLW